MNIRVFSVSFLFVVATTTSYGLTAPIPNRSVKVEVHKGWYGFDEFKFKERGEIKRATYFYFGEFDFRIPCRLEFAMFMVLTPICISLTGLIWKSSELVRRRR